MIQLPLLTALIDEDGIYRIVGKFGKFGESSAIRQTKTIQTFPF